MLLAGFQSLFKISLELDGNGTGANDLCTGSFKYTVGSKEGAFFFPTHILDVIYENCTETKLGIPIQKL